MKTILFPVLMFLCFVVAMIQLASLAVYQLARVVLCVSRLGMDGDSGEVRTLWEKRGEK